MSRPSRLRSLRVQLPATFVALAVLPVLLLGFVGLRLTADAVHQGVAQRNLQVAQAVAAEVDRYLDAQVLHVKELALVGAASGSSAIDFSEHAALHLAANASLRTVLYLDERSRVTAVVPPSSDLLGTDYSGQPFVREARQRGAPTWSSATFSPQTGQPAVTLVVPVGGRMVVTYLDLDVLAAIVERARSMPSAHAAVADRDGTVIAHDEPRLVQQRTSLAELPPIGAALRGAEATAEFDWSGRRMLGSATLVPQTGWVVMVYQESDSAFAVARRTRTLLGAGLVLVGFLGALAGLASARRILRPVEALGEAAGRLALGPGDATGLALEHRGFSEVAGLATAFERMAAAVRAREAELARSEQSYRRLVDAPAVGVLRTSREGLILYCNPGFARMMGYRDPAELIGQNMLGFYVDGADRERIVREALESGRAVNAEVELQARNGKRALLLNVADDEGAFTTVLVDITDRKAAAADRERLEQQLQHAQRVEAVGRLAGGVAHDLNNLLTAIVGFGNLLRDSVPAGGDQRECVDSILEASDRATHLTRSLLAFSRRQVLRRHPVDLREVAGRVARLLEHIIGEDVLLAVDLPAAPLVAVVDPGKIEQVLVNLCTNARDAMPDGGRIAVSAHPAEVSPEEALARGLARGGSYVRIEVSDTGSGMGPEVLGRIFEPFFTTKRSGQGTGLGLSIVHGIVRQHDGDVSVRSAPGEGSTFTVLLPAAPATAVATALVATPTPDPGAQGTETVLLAEDEELVRRTLGTVLSRAGYKVVLAENGAEAVERFRADPHGIALCILDVVMPVMNGRDACDAIRAIDPGARILLASGYAAEVLATRGLGEGGPELLAKPVAPGELLRKVRVTLDRPRG